MKQLRILAVSFDAKLQPWEIVQFRGAMARKVGLEHDWFHNHNNKTGGFHQRYPLIQYKVQPHAGAFRPLLLCLDQGIEEAHHFFAQPDWSLDIGGDVRAMRIAQLDVRQQNLCVRNDQISAYRLHNWQALNPEHYREYRALEGIAERFAFLENILAGHILAFARGVNCNLEQRFEPKITNLMEEKWMEYKDVKVLSFGVEFKTGVSLPEWIGLGKGSSIGWGVLRSRSQYRA
jgi:Cas6b C-terminal domain/Cas6b N-terminal domain